MTTETSVAGGAAATVQVLRTIDHTQAHNPFGSAHCTVCEKVVGLNKYGRCPATISDASARAKPRQPYVRQESPVKVEVPVVGKTGDRYTCSELDSEGKPHGDVTLNKRGSCPKCSIQMQAAGWAAYHVERAAAEQAGDAVSEEAAAAEAAVPDEAPTEGALLTAEIFEGRVLPDGEAIDAEVGSDIVATTPAEKQALLDRQFDAIKNSPELQREFLERRTDFYDEAAHAAEIAAEHIEAQTLLPVPQVDEQGVPYVDALTTPKSAADEALEAELAAEQVAVHRRTRRKR